MINQTLIDTNQTLESSKAKINQDLSEIVNYPGTQRKKDSTHFNFNSKNLDSAKNSVKIYINYIINYITKLSPLILAKNVITRKRNKTEQPQ
jgi:hypothetical protein